MLVLPLVNFLSLTVLLSGCLVPVVCLEFGFPEFEAHDYADLIQHNSYIALKAIQVTPDVNGQSIQNFSGRSLFKTPFRLWNNAGKKASFNTSFVLRIKNETNPGGEGLAFVLTANESLPENSHGQWLGIVNSQSNGSSQARIVAIEFDTRKSFEQDIDDNHVGLDINSIYSTTQVSLTSRGVSIDSDQDIPVVVEYDGRNLRVFVGKNSTEPIINEPIDLSVYLPQKVYVGFSASTSNFTELNCIRSWEFNGSKIDDNSNILWICIVVPVVVVVLICAVLFWYWKRRYDKVKIEDSYPSIEEAIMGSSTAPQKFRLRELRKATGNFYPKNKLGKGGFGTVYKGVLLQKEVAVKRISQKSTQGKQEFIAEVATIGNLHHRNLVKLIGWCYESKEFLLVYEYMSNGSLDKYIYSDRKGNEPVLTMSWERRVSVITGVAQALEYLHNGCEKRVLHRDIKASNIMLDSDFSAKLGDFGLARTIKTSEQTHHSTRELAGTPGYMAPESILTGRATVETDVYAFGVLVLEVACGRKPGGQAEQNDYTSNIVHWLWELHRNDTIINAADPRLNGDFDHEDMKCVLVLGLSCCHPNPNQRPSMKYVLQVLTGEAPAPEVPSERPAFIWPPLPPSFKDVGHCQDSAQITGFTELRGR
ncbi:hypothetical protein K2173_024118 [Erythroxylum novogranatense]|uniref:Protein kinase domain-containing protein n=1 Tax=Erythroxylum novogranatense TaxID=1862640 RepID=A0AAV8UC75_9ROSI|nr:hypothetical protein K2173_024118 [Erythroxylum novogranatense]